MGGSRSLGGWEAAQKAGRVPSFSFTMCDGNAFGLLTSKEPKMKGFHILPPGQ